jgi:hypothetical protein
MSGGARVAVSRYHTQRGCQLAEFFNETNEYRLSRRCRCVLCHMDRSHRRSEVLAPSAFISRREGRYIFAIRTPACLKAVYRSGSIRPALGTANYQMAASPLHAARPALHVLQRIRMSRCFGSTASIGPCKPFACRGILRLAASSNAPSHMGSRAAGDDRSDFRLSRQQGFSAA